MSEVMQPSADILAASREHCRDLSRERAKNFYYGMKLVPEPKRGAMEALYAWMRLADDLADEEGSEADKTQALAAFQRETHQAVDPALSDASQLPAGPIWPAVREMMLTYAVPMDYFDAMIDGQLLDQRKRRYASFDELYDYCYKVASVVGLSCIEIWGYRGGAETRKLSEYRGIAFQLTNILRDVLEDAERDRVYVPADALDLFELNPPLFTMGDRKDAERAVASLAERAADYYEKSEPLDAQVHPDGRPCLWAMTQIYRSLLEKIRHNPAAVLSEERVRLSRPRKAWIALRAVVGKGSGKAAKW
ncbi:MAG: phytoene/squalene synthase family protein [Phycisphaeraceae bacterium]